MTAHRLYFTERGLPLVYTGSPLDGCRVLTCENYLKWYCLYLLDERGQVEPLSFTAFEGLLPVEETTVGDHVVNPRAVHAWVEREVDAGRRVVLDVPSFEMMIGRWATDHDNWSPELG